MSGSDHARPNYPNSMADCRAHINDPSVVPPSGVKVISIGRAPESNVRLDYPMISGLIARITQDTGGWMIEDLGSTNGTALNVLDNKIQRARLQLSDEVYFGSFKIPARRLVSGEPIAQGESAFDEVRFRGDKMILGRVPSCDYPLPYPMISSGDMSAWSAPPTEYMSTILHRRMEPILTGSGSRARR